MSNNNNENPLQPRGIQDPFTPADNPMHVYRHHLCLTDGIGYPTPNNADPSELILEASEGFIPLWAKGVVLRWKFNHISMSYFQHPSAAEAAIKNLFAKAINLWGDAVPVKFKQVEDTWDFEIVMKHYDDCALGGCVLASAFFPDSGRHNLEIYPKMFEETEQEQIETLAHELGHIFGLRHFFAKIKESAWPSVIFGEHDERSPFSIMNYGEYSMLTKADKRDLKTLYQKVWSGELDAINGTKVVQVKPYHYLGFGG